MTDMRLLATANLRGLIAKTEVTVGELKAELDRREYLDQHREIAGLEDHMKSAEMSLKTIRDVLAYFMEDARSVNG